MPTPAERRALVFLAGLVVLGSGARMWNATAHATAPSAASREALSRQLAAVDSVRARAHGGGGKGKASKRDGAKTRSTRSRRGGESQIVVGTSRGSTSLRSLHERAEIVLRRKTVAGITARGTVTGAVTPGGVPVVSPLPAQGAGLIDLDRASAAEIERLPRIGPVLARRIVADRDALGPFGSLQGLQRVKGIGPALARYVAPYVTFSLSPRPSRVLERGYAGAPQPRRRRPP